MATPSAAAMTLPPPPPVHPAVQQSLHQKLPVPMPCVPGMPPTLPAMPRPMLPLAVQPMDLQRSQMLDLRFRYSLALQHTAMGGLPGLPPMHPGGHLHDPAVMAAYLYSKNMDPRTRFFQEEPKPSQSYIGLIAMALLSSSESKLVLGDIYQWILDNYPYFRSRGPGWRNSIRHNLSLNDCFIKSGRAANGKGHYWAIHPANVDDFKRGDFRRRRAQRKVRKAMGLDVPDEEDSPSPPPGSDGVMTWRDRMLQDPAHRPRYPQQPINDSPPQPREGKATKRGFDMASLLAPEKDTSSDSMDDSGIHTSGLEPADLSAASRQAGDESAGEDDVYIDVDSTGEEEPERPLGGVKRKLDLDDTDDSISAPRKQLRIDTGEDRTVATPTVSPPEEQSPPHSGPRPGDVGTSMAAWPRPVCPPIWTPGQPSAFYPNPLFAWGGLQGFPAMYPAALRPAVPTPEAGAVSPNVDNEDVRRDHHDEKIAIKSEHGVMQGSPDSQR